MKKSNAVALMSRIREKANKLIINELEKHGIEGIVPSHGEILYLLFAGKTYTMKELAEKIRRTKPTVTVLVDKLVDYGYVRKEKSMEDSRVTFIRLTEKGLELEPVFMAVTDKLLSTAYNGLTEQQAIALEETLEKINKNFTIK
jgi:DNA-binding MarR family transcriptional regulator